MKNILYINGSPRGEGESTSGVILRDIHRILVSDGPGHGEPDLLTLPVQKGRREEEILRRMDEADAWVIAFPLYIFALPGHLTWWLMRYEEYRTRGGACRPIRIYAAANCGFPEPSHCRSALTVIRLFCRRNGLDWRLGIAMGKGEPYKQMKDMPLTSRMKSGILEAYKTLAADMAAETPAAGDIFPVSLRMPDSLYRLMGTVGWKLRIRKSGLKGKDLHARPLLTPPARV